MTGFLVVDASLAVKLLLPNEQRADLGQLIQQWSGANVTLRAPTLWAYELTSALSKLVHFGELLEDEAKQALHLAQTLNIELIAPTTELMDRAFAWTRRLNRVVAYDSFYLALAESLECEVWTADKRLANAVDVSWVKLAV